MAINKQQSSIETDKSIFFYYEEDAKYGCFSNFYKSLIVDRTVDRNSTIQYHTSEQHFMANKARFFGATELLKQILASKTPGDAKVLGSTRIPSFDRNLWDKESPKFMKIALYLKFSQNDTIRKILLDTGTKDLYEAAPSDRIWGIERDAKTAQREENNPLLKGKWGQNELGKALMEVRDGLRNTTINVEQKINTLMSKIIYPPLFGKKESKRPSTGTPINPADPVAGLTGVPVAAGPPAATGPPAGPPTGIPADPPTGPPTGPPASTPPPPPPPTPNTNNNSIAEYQKDIIDIYGKLYYIGDTLTSSYLKKMNIRMNKQLKTINHLLEPKDSTIYTSVDFKTEYVKSSNQDFDELAKVCKTYLQLGKTYIKDCIKDGKDIQVENDTEKELLSYILTTRKKQLASDPVDTILSLHGRSYLQLHNSIIAKIQVVKKPVDNESDIMDFLLFYVWNILQNQKKTPVNAKTEWNKASPKKTWHEMLLDIRNKTTIKNVIKAIVDIQKTNNELQGLSNAYKPTQTITKEKIESYLKNLLTIIKGYNVSAETEEEKEEKEENNKIAALVAAAFTKYLGLDTMSPKKPIVIQSHNELKSTSVFIKNEYNNEAARKAANFATIEAPRSLMGGGSLLPPPFFIQALQPIMHYLHTNHSIYSFITDIVPSYNIIGDMQQLHHICSSITNEKQYGFYRIKHIPSELFTHIQQLIDCSTAYTSHNGTHYSASHCNTDSDYLYFLCLDGNIAFTDDVTEKKQIKEQTAVRTFFQEKTLYLLYSPKKEVRMSNYMRDPYYVYDINYDDINHDTHQIRIRNIDTLLNKQDIPLGNYLTVESKKLVDICQLELSLIHQLNHLIVV